MLSFSSMRKQIFFTLAMGLVANTTSAFAGPKPITQVNLDTDPRWSVVYGGKTYNAADNQTTFTYTVSVAADPALSHFTAGFPLCDELSVVTYGPEDARVGLDPTTGVYGIKWDIGLDPGAARTYSFTLLGNIGEGKVDVAVKAGLFAAIGERSGPSCQSIAQSNSFDISGNLFLDPNKDGVQNAQETGMANITVGLYDSNQNLVATTITDIDGYYVFSGLQSGNYIVLIPTETDVKDFNGHLGEYFVGTTPDVVNIALYGGDSVGNNFGYVPDALAVLQDFDAADPDADGFVFTGTGKTIGFWKHQLAVAIKGNGRAQVEAATLKDYVNKIDTLYLPNPFVLQGSFDAAHNILKSTSSVAVDLLLKQLLGTEFNEMDGRGLIGDNQQLQSLLIFWGESLAANQAAYTREQLLTAKNIFDAINNSGE